MSTRPPVIAFWHRRDLRLHDNAGLYHALRDARAQGLAVLPVFLFDREILDVLPLLDYRVLFIHRQAARLRDELARQGVPFEIRYGRPAEVWPAIFQQYDVRALYTNRDYEPYAHTRDAAVAEIAQQHRADFKDFKDHVVFEKHEVLSKSGTHFRVFTPYKNAWLTKLRPFYLQSYPTQSYADAYFRAPALPLPSLSDMGFDDDPEADRRFPPPQVDDALLRQYAERRNFPAQDGTSRLGVHLRFGTVSIRQLAQQAHALSARSGGAATYLSELVWRDFYSMILAAFPQVVGHAFNPAYEHIAWRTAPAEFERWQHGQTGYPLVDAGMRELNATGYMHNRVRMVVASFLTKHLLIDWRLGEAYFAEKLLDFDLASNNGGWQWAAGTGADAAPYFRVFNPEEQARKFDPDGRYIRRWVPEYGTPAYTRPVVEHKFARERALAAFKEGLAAAR